MTYKRPDKERTSAANLAAWRQEYQLAKRRFRSRLISETELRDRLVVLGFGSEALRLEIVDAVKGRQTADWPPEVERATP